MKDLLTVARDARLVALKMVHKARAAHIGSSLSVIDILVAAYSFRISNPGSEVLLSKGHAAAGLYAVLNKFGEIPDSWVETYCEDGSKLGGHATKADIPGVVFSTGSLGHALPFAVGVSYRKKLAKESGHTIVVMSDGECDEGSNWEAALVAAHLGLNNLVAIIDRNRLQSFQDTEQTIRLDPLDLKWESFGWKVSELNGHDINLITETLMSPSPEKPHLIIANTVKGKGVSFMEGNNLWHYRSPNDLELEQAITELSRP